MSDVFISYSREDLMVMQSVRDSLRAAGIVVWTDENLVPGTASWKRAIQDAIENAKCLTVIMSPTAKESKWVREEIDYASNHELDIFPILALGDKKTSVPFGLSGSQWIDIRQPESFEREISRLVAALIDKYKLRISSDQITVTQVKTTHAVEKPPKGWPARYYKRLEFWDGLLKKSNEQTNLFHSISPSKHATISKSILPGIKLDYRINMGSATVRLYIDIGSKEDNQRVFDALYREKDRIEREVSSSLTWDTHDGERAFSVSKTIYIGGLSNPDLWPEIQDAMVKEMNWLDVVFRPRLEKILA